MAPPKWRGTCASTTEEAVSCSLGDALVLALTLTQCPDDVWLHPQTLIDCAPLPSH